MKSRDNDHSQQPGQRRYDDALLCANWNPVLDLIEWPRRRADESSRPAVRPLEEDAGAFLDRVYLLGA